MGKYLDKEGLGHLAQRLGAGKSVVSNLSDIGTVASDDSVGLMIDAERLAVGTGSVSTSQNAVIGTIPAATQEAAGVMSAADKKKLDEDVALKEDVESAEFTPTGLEVKVPGIYADNTYRMNVTLNYEKGGKAGSVSGYAAWEIPNATEESNGLLTSVYYRLLDSFDSKAFVSGISGTSLSRTKDSVGAVLTLDTRTWCLHLDTGEMEWNDSTISRRWDIPSATQSAAGVMSAADKAKLDGLDAVATQSKDGLMSAADKKKLDKMDPGELALLDDVDSVDFVPTGIVAETVAQAVVNNNSCPMVEMTLEYDKGGAGGSVKGTFTVELNTATASMGAMKGVGGLMSGDDKAKLDKMEPDELVRKGEVWQKDVSGDFDFNGATEVGCYFHDGIGSISNGPGESVALGGGFALWVVRTSSLCTMQLVRPGNMFMAGFVCFREFMHSLSSFGKWYIVNLNTLCSPTA